MDSLIAANIGQRPLRTAISVVGVSLGVILVTLFVGLARGMTRDAAERQANVDAEVRFLSSADPSLAGNPLMLRAGYADAILRGVQPTAEDPDIEPKPPIAGVAAASPVGEYLQGSVAGIGFEMVDGIDYPSFVQTARLSLLSGRGLGDGRTPGSEYEVIVDRYYANLAKGIDGNTIRVGSQITVLGHQFTIVGIYEPSILGRMKIPLYTMQQLLGGTDNCTFISVKCERPELADRVVEQLRRFYPGNHAILTSEIPALYSQGLAWVDVFLNVVIGLALVISTLVILLAMYTTIIERTREIGILKSLGASKRFIVLTIEKEAALISVMGVVFGFTLSLAGKLWLEANTRLLVDLHPKWLILAALIGILGGILGALYPAMRAANLDPVEAISYD
ncbi:MAG TPA: FtsX-like permease family protein [Blastocatellia bacterium]|nr:FtsX-like permease family protein [Blastocatellia bacterium]